MIQPTIQEIPEKKLIGKSLAMSLVNNRVHELWRSFMLAKNQVKDGVSSDLISMSVYESQYFEKFNPSNIFEKWAVMEVSQIESCPEGMKTFILPAGLYAVFHYQGPSTDHRIYEYIFRTWLPQSGYQLDDRPHFEVLGAKYKNNDSQSEEDIYIPIRK